MVNNKYYVYLRKKTEELLGFIVFLDTWKMKQNTLTLPNIIGCYFFLISLICQLKIAVGAVC